jgi:DNA-binding GntR family transcriptional regulator
LQVVSFVRTAILNGVLRPGERLREDELAAELSVSRTPVREALRILAAEGHVESTPYAGARVRVYDQGEIDSAMQTRALIEGVAARRAALRRCTSQLEDMQASCARYEDLGNVDEENLDDVIRENNFFHDIILRASGSAVIFDTVHRLWAITMSSPPAVGLSSGDQKRISEHSHRKLTETIAAGDGDGAETVARAHVQDLRDRLVPHEAVVVAPLRLVTADGRQVVAVSADAPPKSLEREPIRGDNH